jgi:putative membrane-bound dehydrogenase-like protein
MLQRRSAAHTPIPSEIHRFSHVVRRLWDSCYNHPSMNARSLCSAILAIVSSNLSLQAAEFRAGAHAEEITPTNFPVLVNAMFTERSAAQAVDPLHARALVLDDGATRLAFCVVDTCMMSRELIDEAKEFARAATGIPTDRMLVSATHTHSAPSAMGCLGSRMDTNYARFLPGRIAAAMTKAARNLSPARVGWAVVDDWEHTHNRRWIRRPDRLLEDPFGERNVRAHMHPGHESKDVVGPSGPVDPALTMLSVVTPEGRPIALLANYSMHYYESPLLSADYFGRFANKIARLVNATNQVTPFVGIMSQGTSGDLMWMDYGRPRTQVGYDAYAEAIARNVFAAWKTIKHRDHVPLAMAEAKVTLGFRVPDERRLAWAREKAASIGDRLPQSQPEIYAKEAIYLHERPRAELKLQAVRIGEFGITAIPNEVFAITGLKLKAQSPLQPLMNVELANGAEGYIPPPEQHRLGGYTTWPARTAGLETNAETRITEALLSLLKRVAGKSPRPISDTQGPYARAVLGSKPSAYWRLNEIDGSVAHNSVKGGPEAAYEPGIALYLRGVENAISATNVRPQQPNAFSGEQINRSPHLAGGRVRVELKNLGDRYSVEGWFWNGLPNDARPVTGYFFSRGIDGAEGAPGDHLGIGGTAGNSGRLIVFNGNRLNTLLAGETVIAPKTWNHVVFSRDGERVEVWLNGRLEIAGAPDVGHAPEVKQLFFGGRNDNFANLEGKLDEVAVFNRVLSPAEIHRHFTASIDASAPPALPNLRALNGPLTPADALYSFESEPGLRVELAAAEPLIAAPCAMAWDARGRLYVAENRGYPNGGRGGRAVGVIAMLEDADRDGIFDKRFEFATGLTFPNGVMPWRGGLIVTCAPDVFYLKDTDGDGKADLKEVLLTGFATNQSTQLRVNKPMLGSDGWVYLASGLSGGRITSPKRPGDKPLELKGDIRFHPDNAEYEPIDGKSQFGQSFDDFGRRFGVFNRVQVQHFVLPSRYIERNPQLASPGVLQNCPELLDNPLMRGGGGAARIYPISANITTADSHAGTFSAACAIHLWRGGALPPDYDGHAFSCDPTGNLVHHDRLEPAGATFAARRVGENIEFLRSRDNWFRPVFLETGPDGALYICDMYRKVIEHPEYLPTEVRKHTDFESGKGLGRIWRVTGKDAPRAGSLRPRWLTALSTRALVNELESANSWRRDTAFRLLLERKDRGAIQPLEAALGPSPHSFLPGKGGRREMRAPGAPGSAARLHLLALLGDLQEAALSQAMNSPEAGVREVALRLAEPRASSSPGLQRDIVRLSDDPDARVRFQCALALGTLPPDTASSEFSVQALASIATRGAADKWTRAAALSSAHGRERQFLSAVLSRPPASNGSVAVLLADLGRVLAGSVRSEQHLGFLEDLLLRTDWDFDRLSGLLAGFAEAKPGVLRSLAGSGGSGAARLGEFLAEASRHVADATAPLPRRVRSAQLLAFADEATATPILLERLQLNEAPELQAAAMRVLTQPLSTNAVRQLLKTERWVTYTPALRGTLRSALLSRPEHHSALLDAIESGAVPASTLDPSQREQLKKSKDNPIQERAGRLFATTAGGDRLKAFEAAKACLKLKASPAKGRETFSRLCATCHRLDREGIAVGPDLFDIRNQSKESILLHIVVPEQEVAPNFANYVCETKDGRTLSGLVTAETAGSVTLRQAQGLEETISRNNIVSLAASQLSLMPQELEKGLTPQDLADLLGYLKGEAE